MLVNQKQLAKILGITARRVRDLKEEGFFENAEGGMRYALEKCVPEYIEYKVNAETGSIGFPSRNVPSTSCAMSSIDRKSVV